MATKELARIHFSMDIEMQFHNQTPTHILLESSKNHLSMSMDTPNEFIHDW